MQEVMSKLIPSIAIVAVLSLIQCKINAKKVNRCKQALFPLWAFVYCVAAVIYTFVNYGKPTEFIAVISSLVNYSEWKELGAADIFAVNVLIYILHVIARFIPGIVVWFILRKYVCVQKFVEIFYTYSDDFGEWFIKDKWTSVRILFKGFVVGGAALNGLVLGLTWYAGSSSPLHVFIFPVIFQIILVEIYNFLNGYTKSEYVRDIAGEDSFAQRINNFYKIREIYEKIFPHELLSSNTRCDYASTRAVTDLLEDLKQSEEELERKVSDFFSLNGKDDIYDTDCIQATLKMLKGENVVFFNPFYRDLGKYLILPFLSTLLSDKKCLVIVGRKSAKDDVIAWVSEILDEYGKIQSLWRVRELDFRDPECEVGVLGFSQLYDQRIIEANSAFFKEVGFVFMLEASMIINTGQVALSILSQQMCNCGDNPVYCIADRLVDGLVDTMSHLLQTEITEVVAAPIARNVHTAMGWNADGDYLRQKLFDKQTKYLGNGIELAAVAVKNQIPSVSWFGETKVPIRDIKWVAGQYYPTLCRYMNLPIQQQSLYDKIQFVSNIWSVSEEKEQFVIAEDEFSNLFSTIRMFLSRGKEHTFVNVLSENYLLRDYMRCNSQMFISNPNVIPSIVPDYAKTEKNTLLKLLIMMTYRDVYESEILHEFGLVGIETDDALQVLTTLLKKYTRADSSVFSIRVERTDIEDRTFAEENVYTIIPEVFDDTFGKSLKNAYYICEEEKQESEYIDAKLFGHITQTILPGQFVTYDGKYYIVQQISMQNGVVLRRASNLYDGRKYYRQIRAYNFEPWSEKSIISMRTVMDVEITKISAEFAVNTTGYLEMNINNDLRSARVIDFSNDPLVDVYSRKYCNKSILRIKLPETTDRIRFSVCMLLAEVFKSVFPDAWQYLAVVTVMPDDVDGMLNYLIYNVNGSIEEDYIYIIEDSELDLGLLEAVEKNLMKFLEIITDFLCWHFEKMREPAMKDPTVVTPEFPTPDFKRQKKFTEMFKRIRTLFGEKKAESVQVDSVENDENKSDKIASDAEGQISRIESEEVYEFITGDAEDAKQSQNRDDLLHDDKQSDDVDEPEHPKPVMFKASNIKLPEDEQFEPDKGEHPDLVAIDGTDIFDNEGMEEHNEYFEECFAEMGITSLEKSRYQKECFLKFGFNEIDSRIQLEEVRKYLVLRGFSNSSFTKARKRDLLEDTIIDLGTVNHCDFCGMPLSGVSFEKLSDGRIRCNDCTASAINSVEEFRKLFYQCMNMMENFFNIEYKVSISVNTTDAKKIAKGFGSVYSPSTEVAERVLGYAQRKNGKFSMFVENGSPRMATITTMVHELTHIWQYLNWSDRDVAKWYPERYQRDMVYEGMAIWVSVQYLYLIGENSYAQKQELIFKNRDDIYGAGFRMFLEKYPLIKDSSLLSFSPFTQLPPM